MNNRENLLRMVSGNGNRRIQMYFLGIGNQGRVLSIDETEVNKLTGDEEDLFLFGTSPDVRDDVLRESPCLVRQPDGKIIARNEGKGGPVYFVE